MRVLRAGPPRSAFHGMSQIGPKVRTFLCPSGAWRQGIGTEATEENRGGALGTHCWSCHLGAWSWRHMAAGTANCLTLRGTWRECKG